MAGKMVVKTEPVWLEEGDEDSIEDDDEREMQYVKIEPFQAVETQLDLEVEEPQPSKLQRRTRLKFRMSAGSEEDDIQSEVEDEQHDTEENNLRGGMESEQESDEDCAQPSMEEIQHIKVEPLDEVESDDPGKEEQQNGPPVKDEMESKETVLTVGDSGKVGKSPSKKLIMPQPHKCRICGHLFPRSSHLSAHFRIHGGGRPYGCGTCGKTFTYNSDLARHERLHNGERPYKCEICGRLFAHSSNLSKHKRTHNGDRPRPYKCDLCGKSFLQSSGLSKHKRTHSGERPYKCNICGKSFSWSNNLSEHLRMHSGERPYKCEVCGRMFSQSSNLSTHLMTHRGDRPYQCTICGNMFSLRRYLSRHVKEHTADRSHKCDICGKLFLRRSNLSTHLRRHSGERPYKCDKCGKSFLETGDLTKHNKQYHIREGLKLSKRSKQLNNERNVDIHSSSVQSNETTVDLSKKQLKIEKLDESLELSNHEQPASKECKKIFKENINMSENDKQLQSETCDNASVLSKLEKQPHSAIYSEGLKKTNQQLHSVKCDDPLLGSIDLSLHRSERNSEECSKTFFESINLSKCTSKQTNTRVFNENINVSKHDVEVKSEELQYRCNLCGRQFVSNDDCEMHKRTHSVQQWYKCEICGKEFSLQSCLEKHVSLH